MRILISAGEASGEMYGAQLMEALRKAAATLGSAPEIEFFGAGGEKMRAAGCNIVVDARDLSVVGITEILGHLPKIWGLFYKMIAEADRRRPDVAVVIDSPAFNWRVARQMHKRGIPVVYYVAPQFWAWRQGRVRLLRRYVDQALVIFPFEEKFYRDHGVNARFIGHPLADLPRPAIERTVYATTHGLDAQKHWIALMPGSRRKEVRMNLPVMLESAAQFGQAYEFVLPVAPTLDRGFIEALVRQAPAGRGVPLHLVPEALPALFHSRAGIVASGTATVEAALMSTPFVMVYRVSGLTYLLGRSQVKVPHFAMVNLIAGKEVVPELVQEDFTAARVVSELSAILQDGPARDTMLEGLAGVKALLRGPADGRGRASERAAVAILGMARSFLAAQQQPDH